MAVHVLVCFSGAPGVTTTAVAWATLSPRPTLIVEAGIWGGSAVVSGLWGGQRPHEQSVLALANSHPDSYVEDLWDQTVALPGTDSGWVLPGIGTPSQARSMRGVWGPLGQSRSGGE